MVFKLVFAKFLEIITTGSLEISKFLRNQLVSIFRATAHALHLTRFFDGSLGNKQNRLRIAGFLALLLFLPYSCIFVIKD